MQERVTYKSTLESLSREYAGWIKENANGRDKQDQRFGQYYFNKYYLCHEGTGAFSSLFYEENTTKAYLQEMNHLLNEQQIMREMLHYEH